MTPPMDCPVPDPDWIALLKVTLVSLVILAIGVGVVLRLAPRYPKLAA